MIIVPVVAVGVFLYFCSCVDSHNKGKAFMGDLQKELVTAHPSQVGNACEEAKSVDEDGLVTFGGEYIASGVEASGTGGRVSNNERHAYFRNGSRDSMVVSGSI